MGLEKHSSTSSSRPNLEEFLSALDGFLAKPTSVSDPTYSKFLGTFCRSIGASEGHFLKNDGQGGLVSLHSIGLQKSFNSSFNKLYNDSKNKNTPMDIAFQKKEVVAIVDLKKEKKLSPWFAKLMQDHRFYSLVVVPIIGRVETAGVLCAYYNDVCLFDRGTIEHLSMIGRMMGTAAEKDKVPSSVPVPKDQSVAHIEDFLSKITGKSFTKIELFTWLVDLLGEDLQVKGIVAGPLREEGKGLSLTMVQGQGIPKTYISRRLMIPPLLRDVFQNPKNQNKLSSISREKLGGFEPMMVDSKVEMLAYPLVWQGKATGGILVWREAGKAFSENDILRVSELAMISAIALHT